MTQHGMSGTSAERKPPDPYARAFIFLPQKLASLVSLCVDPVYGVRRKVLAYSVSVSVALLLARFGSVTPLGALTLAVSEIDPLAELLIVPVALYVILLPEGIVTASLMLPVPAVLNPKAPPVWVAV